MPIELSFFQVQKIGFGSARREDIVASGITIKDARPLKNRRKNDIVGDMIFLPLRQVTPLLSLKQVINE